MTNMGHSADVSSKTADETAPLLQQQDGSAEPATTVDEISQEERSLAENSLTRLRAFLIILLFALLIFVQTSNVSLITTISGSIAHDLDAFEDVSWFTSAYLIAMSCTTPLAGRLCKIFAPRFYIFCSGMILSIGLLITAFAQSELAFLMGRVCSGIGAGGCFTVAIIVATDYASSRWRGFFLGLVNTGFTVGVASGSALSGAIDSAVGWRAVFWLQTPIAVGAASGLLFAIPRRTGASLKIPADESWTTKLRRIDYAGSATFITSIVLLLYSLAATEIHVLPIILSIFGFSALLLIERYYAAEPIFPLPILKTRAVFLTCLSTLGYMSSRWTVLFYTPVYTIAVRQWSRATAGLILIPTNAGFAFGGLIVGWFHIRGASSFYWSCIIVYVTFIATLYLLSALSTDNSPVVAFIVTTSANGFVTGATLNYVLAHALFITPVASHSIVVSLIALSRGLGGSLGSSIGGGIFLRALERSLKAGFKEEGLTGTEDLVRRLLGSPALVQNLVGVEYEVAKSAYESAIRNLFLAGCGLVIAMIPLQAGTGWNTARIEDVEINDELQGEGNTVERDEL